MKEEMNIEELVKIARNTAKQMNYKAFLCRMDPRNGNFDDTVKMCAMSARVADLLEELMQYREVGTVIECQDAVARIKKLKEWASNAEPDAKQSEWREKMMRKFTEVK